MHGDLHSMHSRLPMHGNKQVHHLMVLMNAGDCVMPQTRPASGAGLQERRVR